MIAEDLATTFYYDGLVGGAIQDTVLAGPGGTATNPGVGGNVSNVGYLRAALDQEISHANLFRALGNFGAAASSDPDQTFYFPIGTFDALAFFMLALDTLESLLIGTYLTAVRELSYLAAQTSRSIPDGPPGGPYSSSQLEYFAMIAAPFWVWNPSIAHWAG